MTTADLEETLDAVAAYGLPGTEAPVLARLGQREWSEFLRACAAQRLIGFAAAAVAAGDAPVDDERHRQLAQAHASASAWVLKLEALLLDVDDWFSAVGIDHRVLKGSSSAHLDYPDPAVRCYGDLDLLVGSGVFGSAASVIEAHGGRRRFPEPRAGFDREFTKGAAFQMPGGAEIDLHRTLTLGWFGLQIPTADLLMEPDAVLVGDRRLCAMPVELRFLHACIHAVLGGAEPSRLALRDVAQLALGGTDAAAVRRVAARWRCEVVVADAIRTSWRRLAPGATPELLRWAEEHDAPRAERRRLGAYQGPRRSHARLALSAVGAVHGIRAKLRYLKAVLFPRRHRDRIPTRRRLRHTLTAARSWCRQ